MKRRPCRLDPAGDPFRQQLSGRAAPLQHRGKHKRALGRVAHLQGLRLQRRSAWQSPAQPAVGAPSLKAWRPAAPCVPPRGQLWQAGSPPPPAPPDAAACWCSEGAMTETGREIATAPSAPAAAGRDGRNRRAVPRSRSPAERSTRGSGQNSRPLYGSSPQTSRLRAGFRYRQGFECSRNRDGRADEV